MEPLNGVAGVVDPSDAGFGADHPGVADLPARLGVERRAVEEDLPALAGFQALAGLAIDQDRQDLPPVALEVVAGEVGEAQVVGEAAVYLGRGEGVTALPGGPGTLPLGGHLLFEADRKSTRLNSSHVKIS